MPLNSIEKETEYPELLKYACRVYQQGEKCNVIMEWLDEKEYRLEDFLLTYTRVKYGKQDLLSYIAVIKEFQEKHKAELTERYDGYTRQRLFSHVFLSSNNPLNFEQNLDPEKEEEIAPASYC